MFFCMFYTLFNHFFSQKKVEYKIWDYPTYFFMTRQQRFFVSLVTNIEKGFNRIIKYNYFTYNFLKSQELTTMLFTVRKRSFNKIAFFIKSLFNLFFSWSFQFQNLGTFNLFSILDNIAFLLRSSNVVSVKYSITRQSCVRCSLLLYQSFQSRNNRVFLKQRVALSFPKQFQIS